MTHRLHPSELATIRDTALGIAGRSTTSESYARALRHIATDAQAAIDGCPASLESVTDWMATDDLLDWEVSRAASVHVKRKAA